MITNGIYFNNNIYTDDIIINVDKPELYKKKKNYTVIINNTKELEEYKDNIQLYYFLTNYKIVYTSDLSKIIYDVFNSDIEYNSALFTIPDKIEKIIDILCIKKNELHVIIYFSKQQLILNTRKNVSFINVVFDETVKYFVNNISSDNHIIENIIYKNNITITDSNIKQIIGSSHEFNNNSSDIVIFVEMKNTKLNFINYIKYKLDGFQDTAVIDLEYSTKHNFKGQIIAIQNILIDYINSYEKINKDKFNLIKNKFIHTIKYYNYVLFESDKIALSEIIADIKTQFNYLQSDQIKFELDLIQPKNNLFVKSLSSIKPNIKNKLTKTFVKNIYKMNDMIDSNEEIIDISQDVKNDKNFIKSLEFYTSQVSLSNWYDEIESKSCLGLLINVSSEFSDKMGYSSESINVINITNTLMSPEQIYDGHKFYWDKYLKLDNGKNQDNIISGSVIGKGNSIIPLYINNFHWEYAQKYIEENISIALTQNPYIYKPIMIDLYSHVFLKFICNVLNDPSDKNIKLFISIFVTMQKLNLDQIKYLYNDYSQINNLRPVIASFFINYICNKIVIDENGFNYYILQIQQELVRRNMKQIYKTKNFLKLSLNNSNQDNIYTNEQLIDFKKLCPSLSDNSGEIPIIEILDYSINKDNIIELENVYTFLKIIKSNIINDILLKYITNYGWLDDNDILEFKNIIKFKTFSFTFKELISKWPESNIKYYSLQTFITRTPKLKEKFKQTNKIIDIKNILDELDYKKLLDIIIN
jgi:hypothetical protein